MLRNLVRLATAIMVFSNSVHAENPANQVTAKFDYESVFEAYPSFWGTHEFSSVHSLTAGVTAYFAVRSLELDLNWNFTLDDFAISPGLGLTFGPVSWTFSADKKQLLGRDITPFIQLHYRNSLFEADGFSQFWFPVQESWATAIGFGEARLWGVIKWNELGIGPHMVAFFTKEGGTPYNLSHYWIGGHVLARVEKATFHLFVAYDTISGIWLGLPKPTGPYYRFTFVYDF